MSIQTNNLPDNPHIEVIKSGRTGLFTNYIYKAIPLAFDESMSYYETLCGLLNYLKNIIIPTVNNNADAVAELQNLYEQLRSYVENYFENLDVQEEINNKLDKMVEDGTLQEIIASYLNSKAIFGYDTVASMKQATNLINGSYASTLGYYEKNDGGKALYKIRTITNQDVVNNMNIIALSNTNLIAELIVGNELNLKQFGCYGNNINDDTNILLYAIEYCDSKSIPLYIPNGKYKISQVIDIPTDFVIYGSNKQWNVASSSKGSELNISNNSYILTNGYCQISNLLINGTGLSNQNTGILLRGGRSYLHDLTIMNFEKGIKNSNDSINLSRFENITITNCKHAIDLSNGDSGSASNSQSLSFVNIDIRECWYGYISNAPSNKFFNFCVQSGNVGNNDGYSIKLLNGSNNNFFYGTYVENANYQKEILCENGAKYNTFTGNRILSNQLQFTDNDGTNIFDAYLTQFNRNVSIGTKYFTKLGVAFSDSSSGYGFNITPRHDDILMDIDGTSSIKTITASDQILLSTDIKLKGRYINTSLPYVANIQFSNVTIESGATYRAVSGYFDKKALLVFATITNSDQLVLLSCETNDINDNITYVIKNISNTQFSGAIKLNAMILY